MDELQEQISADRKRFEKIYDNLFDSEEGIIAPGSLTGYMNMKDQIGGYNPLEVVETFAQGFEYKISKEFVDHKDGMGSCFVHVRVNIDGPEITGVVHASIGRYSGEHADFFSACVRRIDKEDIHEGRMTNKNEGYGITMDYMGLLTYPGGFPDTTAEAVEYLNELFFWEEILLEKFENERTSESLIQRN